MIKGKLIDILENFSESEFRDFGKYVNSPYFNSNNKLTVTYGYFRKYFNKFSHSGFTKECLYNEVFPGTAYRDSETRKLLSGLTKLAEGFLMQIAYDNDKFEKDINLAGMFIGKNNLIHAERLIQALEKVSSEEKINGQHYFYNMMQVQIKKKSIEIKKESFQTRDFAEDNINIFLLCYFISFSIKIVQNINAKQYYNLISADTELTKLFTLLDIDKYIDWLKNRESKYSDTIIMYLCIIKCLNNIYDINSYKTFKELLLKNYSQYSHMELINLFTCMQGILINRTRENDPGALPEIFDVNNLILEHKAYSMYPGGSMNYGTFVTMITIAISYKKHEWARKFIDKYTPLLNEKHRLSLNNYAMAELAYATGSPGESLKYSGKIEYEGFFMKHEVNVLKLKIFYDENDFVSIYYQLDTYRKLVEGNKFVGDKQYDIYSNFLKVYSELVKIKENEDKTGPALLLKKIETTNNMLAKEWLLEKVKKLC